LRTKKNKLLFTFNSHFYILGSFKDLIEKKTLFMRKNTLKKTSHFLRISSESRRKTEDQTETKRK